VEAEVEEDEEPLPAEEPDDELDDEPDDDDEDEVSFFAACLYWSER